MTVDKTLLIAVLAGAALAGTYASCANSCSGHGTCGSHDRCSCYPMFEGTDCSLKSCPSGPAFVDGANAGDVHAYATCSGRGTCDQESGECQCADGFTGYNCGRSVCPNDCSGHGQCTFAKDISSAGYNAYDAGMTRSCVCDGYYSGADCSFRQCPRGDDPLTTEIECQGVASGLQAHEVQEITINADTMLSGEMTLTYTDAYGQSWTTTPIAVGGDNKFDLRLGSSNNAKCSFVYVDAADSPAQYSDGTSTATDFAGRVHTSPADASAGLEATLCNAATAAELDAIISHHSAVSNIHVTKSTDVSGGAKFEITVGGFRAQTGNTAGEIGYMSIMEDGASAASGSVHTLGDHSEDIARALTSLPYNVIPSVTVTKQTILASDYATADVVNGNAIQQTYQVTFSDAANAGDQNLLQCNAAPCNDDGCAPRSAGVNHEKFISTTNHHDDKIADYKTAIVATGQGGFWLRSHKSSNWGVTTWTSGNYFIHRDLGNGKTSSATFQFDADAAAIQTALQTVEGWGGVTVVCNSGADSYAKGKGTAAKAGHSTSAHGLECYVTYAVGYDDGGRLPTMTYTNFNGDQSANTNTEFQCMNEICAVRPADFATATDNFAIGHGAGSTDTSPKYENVGGYVYITGVDGHQQTCTFASITTTTGHTVTQASSGAVGKVGDGATATAQKFVVTNGIDFDSDGPIVINGVSVALATAGCAAANHAAFTTGTYEIIRTASISASITTFLIFAPGQADCADYTACFNPNGISNDLGKVHDTTPLMPMWPSISNSIALHDTTLRVIFDAGLNTANPMDDVTGFDTLTRVGLFNIGYGSLGYQSDGTAGTFFTVHSTCEDIQTLLIKYKDGGDTGYSTTNTPYPSLVDPNDATKSICDCRKMDSLDIGTASVMWDITCPAFIGNLLWPTVAGDADSAIAGGATSGKRRIAKITTGAERAYVNFVYIRQTPPSGLDTKVAVGDTITVLNSNSNTNKQYQVKSFVDDGRWGSGKSNIWSTAAGHLGKDGTTSEGMVHANAIVLDSKMDYRAYGDFVQFAKVDPAPTSDYQITEMKAVGQNSTLFTRTLESISTTDTSIVSLTFYDGKATGDANAALLTGTFQLIYDGEETAVMQALVSAADMQESLAGLSNMGSVTPTVSRSAVTAISTSVTWSITFNAITGDAKKLTFKYTDTIGTERQSSNVIASDGSTALANTAARNVAGNYYASTKMTNIVVQYAQEGSTFFDTLDGTATSVHDELAGDVTVGTTFTVQASEVIQYFIFDEGAGGTTALTDAEICGNNDPFMTFEYNGKVSAPVAICATSAFNSDAAMTTAVQTLTGLESATCAWSGDDVASRTSSDARTEFALAFPWAASHTGAAQAMLACTLPLGVDGSSFKIHAMLDTEGWRVGDGTNSGQAYQYRKRHNNGRSFTVTQAYENKVADMTHFSLAPALSGVSSGSGDAVLNFGSSYGVVASFLAAAGVGAGNYNPGTYYNVKLWGGATVAGTGAIQSNAFAKVVVGSTGVSQIEIVAGGKMVDPATAATLKYVIQCDTRINSDLTCNQATGAATPTTAKIDVTIGDQSTGAKWNTLTASAAIGTSTTTAPVGNSLCTSNTAVKRNVIGTCVSDDDTVSLKGVRLDCTCGASDVNLASCMVVGGGSTIEVGQVSVAEMLKAQTCTLTGQGLTGTVTINLLAANVNTFYHVAGFYDTGTPKFFVDALHEGLMDGELMQASGAFTVMGGISGASNYLYRGKVGVNEVQMYHDLNSIGDQGAGVGRDASAERETASLVMGEGTRSITQTGASWWVEHAQKYQYAGRGFDQLTVSPAPDRMAGQKIVVTYRGAAGACSVKEVDRGTHESSVCSGRGNCDGATGTCVCDAGYTLEACSEQTVLV